MELLAHIEAMPAIRAERMLDAAQVALYPQMKPDHAKPWWDRLMSDTQDTIKEAVRGARRAPLFKFNGMAIGVRDLKTKLASVLGGGFSA